MLVDVGRRTASLSLAVDRTNRATFWKTVWNENVLTIVMLYELLENVRQIGLHHRGCRMSCFVV